MKKLVIDKDLCIGCGTCATLAPKTFKLADDGKAQVINQEGDDQEAIENAIDSCPVQAISWKE
ncbi:ferredoxin [Candidatus Microgenomates bacterium]|nr:ferredoxin [Candidatus Microgenomates bacterium]